MEPSAAEFEALWKAVQFLRIVSAAAAVAGDAEGDDTSSMEMQEQLAQSTEVIEKAFGDEPRFRVAENIRDWQANVLKERMYFFRGLWLRRCLAYALGVGGDLWNPPTTVFGFEQKADMISEAKIFRYLGRTIGFFWIAALFGLVWWLVLYKTGCCGDSVAAESRNSTLLAAPSATNGGVGLADVMVPLFIIGMVVVVIEPYREACTCACVRASVCLVLEQSKQQEGSDAWHSLSALSSL